MEKGSIVKATEDVKIIRDFVNPQQLQVMGDGCRGEEKEYFFCKLSEYAKRISEMPETYKAVPGDKAIVHLHYFKGGADWYIIEKDMGDPDLPGQHQAFGYADLGFGFPELGYISIVELLQNGVELDLHFTPRTLGEVKAKHER